MVNAKLDKINERRINKAFDKMSKLAGEPVHDTLKKQGRLFARDAAKFTPRFGTSQAGTKQKKDVRTTIQSTYMRPLNVAKVISIKGGVTAKKRFSGYIRKRDIAKAQMLLDTVSPEIDGHRVIVGMFDNGKLHQKRLKGKHKTRLCVMDYRSVQQYQKAQLLKVGELKSGWAKAAEMLGGSRGIPAYAKKAHHKTRGKGEVRGKGSKAVLFLANYTKVKLHKNSFKKLWRLRAKNIEKIATRIIKREQKKLAKQLKVGE